MTTPDPAAAPALRLVGRWTYRLLLLGFLLAILLTVVLVLQDSDSFLMGLIAIGFFGLLLAGAPAVLFLIYSWRQAPEVTALTRRSIYASAGSLAVIGAVYAWLSLSAEDRSIGAAALGGLVAVVGLAAIARLLAFKSPEAPVTRLVYARFSGVGLLFFVIVAVATPKFACGCGGKGSAYKTTVQSDLRNLAVAQDVYFADSLRYGSTRELAAGFTASTGDSIVVEFADAKGYRALGWHMYLPDTRCGIWVGVAPADGMHGATEGAPVCWKVN